MLKNNPYKVSEKDKRLFRLIGEALNEPPVKMTKEEKLKSFDMAGYFKFLGESLDFSEQLKGKLTATHDDTPFKIHQKALKLNMVRYR